MTAITEGLNLGDLLKYEAPNLYSRDQVTVAALHRLQAPQYARPADSPSPGSSSG